MKISQERRRAICERDGVLDPRGFDAHHCFFHSEVDYGVPKEFLDEDWNITALSRFKHDCIHHKSTEEMAFIGYVAEIKCKEEALERLGDHKYRVKLEEILLRKKKSYGIL